jgi:hypothetical protein
MLVTESGITMLVRVVQSENAPSEMTLTDFLIVMCNGHPIPLNVRFEMLSSPIEISRFARFTQPENAPTPIDVTESGRAMLARLVQPQNARQPMFVTESGISTLARLVQSLNA